MLCSEFLSEIKLIELLLELKFLSIKQPLEKMYLALGLLLMTDFWKCLGLVEVRAESEVRLA